MSDSNFSIQFASELRRWNSEIYEYITTYNYNDNKLSYVPTSSKRAWLLILSIFLGGSGGRFFIANSFFSCKKKNSNIQILLETAEKESEALKTHVLQNIGQRSR